MQNLADIARQALTTPLLDASAALDVLADALLVEGLIKEPWGPSKKSVRERDRRRARNYVLSQALEWARSQNRERLVVGVDPALNFDVGMTLYTSDLTGRAVITSIDRAAGTIELQPLSGLVEPSSGWRYSPYKKDRRGIGNAPLALRTKLKPWER